jgi:SAM-dependent methyltransferase
MLWKLYSVFISVSKVFSRKGIYPFLRQQLSAIGPEERVLAVGASGPTASLVKEEAARRGFHVTFLDVDPDTEPDIVADLCVHDLGPEGSFGHVVLSEVLEHLHSPQEAIDRVHRALSRGGKLVVTVPFIFPIHAWPHDYYRYTRYGLSHLLRAFAEVSIRERNSWSESILVLIARLAMETRRSAQLLAPFALLFVAAATPFAWVLSKLVRSDFLTTGYVVVARK